MNEKSKDETKSYWERLSCELKNFALYMAIPKWI